MQLVDEDETEVSSDNRTVASSGDRMPELSLVRAPKLVVGSQVGKH